MKQAVRATLSAFAGTVLLICGSPSGSAGGSVPSWLDAERFRELPWGFASEKARAVYPDLSFARYAVSDGKETPSKVYERKHEVRSVNGVRVDEILYWFRDDSFYKVTATLSSRVGPRTLETPAAEAYGKLRDTLCRIAGAPREDRAHGGTWNGNRKEVWRHGDLTVVLSRFDPPGVNGEEMVLEIAKRPANLKTPDPE
jgi:hypothetical protein